MAFAVIRANFDKMWEAYPVHTGLPTGIKNYLADLKKHGATALGPCCLQVSWALNAADHKIPTHSHRRENAFIDGRYHVGSTDELETHLTTRYGGTENIRKDSKGKTRSLPEMKEYLQSRQGILVFRDMKLGVHTELWNTNAIRQKGGGPGGMNEGYIFGQPRIMFWEVANTSNAPAQWDVPEWLRGWWAVSDGQSYWYYFSDRGTVTYLKSAPKDKKRPPMTMPLNSGKVTVSEDAPHVVIEWNPADGGATVERFRYWGNKAAMDGTSNRYGNLSARKL